MANKLNPNVRIIIKKIRAGKLTRENDELYAGGFWDYAQEIALDVALKQIDRDESKMPVYADLNVVEAIYNVAWDTYEARQ